MKKIFACAALTLGAHSLHAQSIAAGTVSLGGTVGYSQASSEGSGVRSSANGQSQSTSSNSTGKQVYLSPSIGYFVADNLAVGLSLYFGNGMREEDQVLAPLGIVQHSEMNVKQLRTGAFVQYYKMLNAQFGITGRLGAGYQRLKEDGNGYTNSNNPPYRYTSSNTSSGYYADLKPGVIFFPVPKLGLSASLGDLSFNHYKLIASSYSDSNGDTFMQGDENASNVFSANFGLDTFLLGGTYYFGR